MLALGVACASTGALFAKGANEAPAVVVSLWRCGAATLILLPVAGPYWLRELPRRLQSEPAVLRTCLLSGLLLAAHFALWIGSLEHLSVAASVFLVQTTPLWVAVLAALFLSERVSRRTRLGLAIGLAGTLTIALGEGQSEGSAAEPLGYVLAVGGALAAAGYMICGRGVRDRLPLLPYLALVYGISALTLGVAAIATNAPLFAYEKTTLVALIGAALIPQLLGHSLVNAALRHLPAATVSVALLGEPVLSSIGAYLAFGEIPSQAIYAGGPILIAGVALAITERERRDAA